MARPPKPILDLSNIVKTKDERWRVDYVRSLPNGQRFRRTTARIDQAEAIQFRDEAIAEYEKLKSGEAIIAEAGYSVQEWCEHCLTAIMPTQANRRHVPYSQNTLDNYRTILRGHVFGRIGSIKLTKLGTEHLDLLMSQVSSPSIKANVKKILSRMLSLAEDRGKRPRGSNPTKSITLPNARRQRTTGKVIKTHERDLHTGRTLSTVETQVPDGLIIEAVRVMSFEEESRLLGYVSEHPRNSDYLTLILLGLRAGLRIGEALALDWSAVDFEGVRITVDQQVQRVKGKGLVVGDPKSQASHRTIPMSKSLAEHLRCVKLASTSPHVVHNNKGERREAARVSHRLRLLIEGAGLNDRIDQAKRRFVPRPTYHDLRRTCLTRLATGNVAPGVNVTPIPPTTLIRISGHEDVETLLSFYTTADDEMVTAAMASMP